MGTRVPVQHYNLNSPSSFIESPLHVLNTVEGRTSDMDDIETEVDREAVTEDSLENENDTNAVDCMHESHRNSLTLHSVEVEEDRSSLETKESSRDIYDILTIDDVSPIESARARFLQLVVDHFIDDHVIEVADSEADYTAQSGQDNKRKTRDAQYEGDPNFALPLMYIANMYESLVNDVNIRLASLNGIREKTIGVALEASGGLYRRLAKKFPKKGPCTYKRRELATSVETRTRFPELVIQEEKRVRFVVINGLKIVENPNNIPIDDAEWFKRLTGRHEFAISARDYKFYSPRHKYRRASSNSLSNISGLPNFPGAENSTTLTTSQGFRSPQHQQQTPCKHHMQSLPHQPQFHSVHQNHQTLHQSQHVGPYSHNHQCGSSSNLSEISHAHQSPTMSQQLACLQTLTGGHVGGRLHMLPKSPAKFCDECGSPYLRETSKFCSECGSKRLGT
ncbi:Zinc finger C2HC domain-containing protein [Senna tora]|uniref:Zinc finger C2HC domain-containing protein n=1 Tax=Senna tora TaxID=362788 RepID=A0A834U0Z9_9FABA|nr:Zinc finger C2HC domain-containing protein [Senna tora]